MIKIDKGIPMPTGRVKYPFAQMKVGDSFAFPIRNRSSVAMSAINYALKHDGTKFTVSAKRGATEGRCWRIK